MVAPAIGRGSLDDALHVRYPATTLALAVLGMQHELEAFSVSEEEILRRLSSLGFLAVDVLAGTARLEAVIDRMDKGQAA